ncbi:MAG: surface lipoprotein assembly modifier [Halieaceae bacterium]|uniref:surface lipoprotein assembly modifier n=1 Tax=Haliea alexandrii TaxID=2448162 RepID=UPI001E54281C|nr:surface lipoprotein assembly modifier [Haliea alexandrii]MCR9183928.1 surface lipoprotein assembly modifier [Halieaceae bacterium]
MQQPSIHLSGVVTLTACLMSMGVAAEEEAPAIPATRYFAELGIGAEYDTNVTIDELDASTREGDAAATLEGKVGMRTYFSPKTDLRLTYDFNQDMYQDFSDLNRQTHIVGANLKTQPGSFDAGFSTFYVNSLLDGNGFLELYRASPYVSGFLSQKWFSRVAYVFSDKQIKERAERDATTHTGEIDLYFFARGLRSYYNMGYRFRDEDANLERLDFTSHAAKLRYIRRVDVGRKVLKVEMAYRYENRDYSGVTPGIGSIEGEPRKDERHRVQIDLEYPVTKQGALQLYLAYGDYQSNFPISDFDQGIVGSRYVYRW